MGDKARDLRARIPASCAFIQYKVPGGPLM